MNITNYINLQDFIGFGLSNEFLQRKLVKISKKVVEVSYISQVPTKAELYVIDERPLTECQEHSNKYAVGLLIGSEVNPDNPNSPGCSC